MSGMEFPLWLKIVLFPVTVWNWLCDKATGAR